MRPADRARLADRLDYPTATDLREARAVLGLTQRDLADRLGVSWGVVRDAEQDRGRPRPETLRALAELVRGSAARSRRTKPAARPAGPATNL